MELVCDRAERPAELAAAAAAREHWDDLQKLQKKQQQGLLEALEA